MKSIWKMAYALFLMACAQAVYSANAVDTLMARYQSAGADSPDPIRGEQLWLSKQGERSCSSCHGTELTRAGKHARTGKRIEPMAPSVNPQRLSRERKIEKWFLRNCKWTWGRECSAQEKADILVWLKQQ